MSTAPLPLAGVIGWPVSHSLSPRLHGHWLGRYGLPGAYLPLAVSPDDLPTAIAGLRALNFVGANITVPHKQAVIPCIDSLDPAARAIGAVNTLIIDERGAIEGRNTDAQGFLAALTAGSAGWNARSGPALVLGAGGAARSIVWALKNAGVHEVRIANRSADKAAALAEEFDAAPVDWAERDAALDGCALLVNTTTLGMDGQAQLEIALDALPTDATVMDIVYAPLETPLLSAARRRGNIAVDGLSMLLHQAVPGFSAWFGKEPQVDDALRKAVLG